MIQHLSALLPAALLAQHSQAATSAAPSDESFQRGPFEPSWDSLAQYQTPEWFRDAKFGIWAHWGPQCQPGVGDWYAREMYIEGSAKYRYHLETYGHPSQFGFKDVIREWKGEHWNPDELLGLYRRAGARYFMAMANHHDNLDLFASKHQAWNSTRVGPRKDIISAWAKAARAQGLPFGVSVHAAHAWTWYETAQRADKKGPLAGVPYDGKLTKQDGRGQWWEGLDPQELYAQDHPLSANSADAQAIHPQWDWGNGASQPSAAYQQNFLNRTLDLLKQHRPDLVYFDDTALPLWPISDAGLKIAAHLYNTSLKKGLPQAVLFGKILDEQQRRCMVWDIERGQSNNIEPLPWQTCTCLGSWHYNRNILRDGRYKSAATVVHTLMDVVSKNGNLLLSVPVQGDGRIDSEERRIVEEIGSWMRINGEAVYGTRPWRQFGEGPAIEHAAPLSAQGFNEGKGKAFGAEDFRFTQGGEALYATFFAWPEGRTVLVKSLAHGRFKTVSQVDLLGGAQALAFRQTEAGLLVTLPESRPAQSFANVLRVV